MTSILPTESPLLAQQAKFSTFPQPLVNQTPITLDQLSEILKCHQLEPIMPLIQNDTSNEYSFLGACSQALFSTTTHQDFILNKCLLSLKTKLKEKVKFYPKISKLNPNPRLYHYAS
jgi:hypothetical protein